MAFVASAQVGSQISVGFCIHHEVLLFLSTVIVCTAYQKKCKLPIRATSINCSFGAILPNVDYLAQGLLLFFFSVLNQQLFIVEYHQQSPITQAIKPLVFHILQIINSDCKLITDFQNALEALPRLVLEMDTGGQQKALPSLHLLTRRFPSYYL